MIPSAQEAAERAAKHRNAKLETERAKVAKVIEQAIKEGKSSCTVQDLSAEMLQELRNLGYEAGTGYSDPRDPYTIYSIKWAWGGN